MVERDELPQFRVQVHAGIDWQVIDQNRIQVIAFAKQKYQVNPIELETHFFKHADRHQLLRRLVQVVRGISLPLLDAGRGQEFVGGVTLGAVKADRLRFKQLLRAHGKGKKQ